jgi:hypothetical protein
MTDNIETTVEILVLPDNDPDTSWLEQDEFSDRLAEYQAGGFGFVGVRARVKVHNWTTGVTKTIESAGLWGVESDSEESYIREVGMEELDALKPEASAMGVDIETSPITFNYTV